MWRRQVDDRQVEALRSQRSGVGDHLRVVVVVAEPDVRGEGDLLRVAADVRAAGRQNVTLLRELLRRAAREVPVVGVLGGERKGALLAAAPDADGRVRLLRPLRFVARILELVVLSVEGRRLLREQAGQHLAGLLEAIEALLHAAEFDAVGAGLLLVPARADAEFEPTVRDDVECAGHLGQHGGMAIVDAGDQHADAQPLRGLRQSRQRCPALEARPGGIGEDRIEVVEGPAGLEYVDVVGGLPGRQHRGPGGVLR